MRFVSLFLAAFAMTVGGAVAVSPPAKAVPMNDTGLPGFQQSFVAGGISPTAVAYDPATSILSLRQADLDPGAPTPRNFVLSAGLGTPTAGFFGVFELLARFDSAGNFSGGGFTLRGGSIELGIAPGTLVLAGAIRLVQADFDALVDPFGFLEFASNPTIVVDALVDEYGPLETLSIQQVIFPRRPGGPFDFTGAFAYDGGPTNGPTIRGSFVRIPEPAALALFAIGLVGLGLAARRRQRT